MEVDRLDPEITYIGTRCCGADRGTPHWLHCRERLDVNDPASYKAAAPDCDQCGIALEPRERGNEFPDGEGGTLVLCGQCLGGIA